MVNDVACNEEMPSAWTLSPRLAEMAKAISGTIKLKRIGGDGREEVQAVLGDKVLDVYIYQRLLSVGNFTQASKITAIRDRLVSNAYLAAIGEKFVRPFLPPNTWKNLTVCRSYGEIIPFLLIDHRFSSRRFMTRARPSRLSSRVPSPPPAPTLSSPARLSTLSTRLSTRWCGMMSCVQRIVWKRYPGHRFHHFIDAESMCI